MKSRLVIIVCADCIFWQLFMRWLYIVIVLYKQLAAGCDKMDFNKSLFMYRQSRGPFSAEHRTEESNSYESL